MGKIMPISEHAGRFVGRDDMPERISALRGPVVVVVLSVANLKAVNRVHGHAAGDRMLVTLRARIGAVLPPDAVFARLSGGKFVIAMREGDAVPLAGFPDAVAARLLSAIGDLAILVPGSIRAGEVQINVELRIGACAAGARTPLSDAAALMDGALAAHDRAQEDQAQIRLSLLDDVAGGAGDIGTARRALAAIRAGQVSIALQSVVSAENPGRIMFREALIRIPGPQGQPLAAGHFMPVLARLDMTEAADIAVLRLAFDHLAADPGLRLSVNLSRGSIARGGWGDVFSDLAMRAPRAAERLIVEVTEDAALSDCAAAATLFMLIRAQGAALALDDFGAGRTSFRHLRDFRFDMVKIDGAFITGIDQSPDNRMMVSALTAIARQFDMMVIAEHVETAAEARTLGRLGVDGFQGFLFGRPALVWADGCTVTSQGLQA